MLIYSRRGACDKNHANTVARNNINGSLRDIFYIQMPVRIEP